jgi:hypothetical protein
MLAARNCIERVSGRFSGSSEITSVVAHRCHLFIGEHVAGRAQEHDRIETGEIFCREGSGVFGELSCPTLFSCDLSEHCNSVRNRSVPKAGGFREYKDRGRGSRNRGRN